ncbi:MAG: hypothetical protein B7Z74_02505, partial [Deltaproteobacteria bacterium 21-66-5]
MSDDSCCSGSGGILLAFLAGGLVGAGLALLYAPVSGREARERIGGLAGDLKKKTDEWAGDVKQKVEGLIDEERSVIKAAYDAGPGKIQRGLNRYDFGELQGNDLFFALADERFLRRETKDYVPKLIAAAMIAKEPEKYGFDHIERWAPLRYDSIEVNYAVGLDVLARLADTTMDAMLELNPEFIRRVTPPNRTVWVRVPVGAADSTAARLAVLPPQHRVTFVEHTIARGETLGRIAQRYHVSVDLILSANRGLKVRSLHPGRVLVIPTSGIAPSRWSTASRPASRAARRPLRRAAPVLLSS